MVAISPTQSFSGFISGDALFTLTDGLAGDAPPTVEMAWECDAPDFAQGREGAFLVRASDLSCAFDVDQPFGVRIDEVGYIEFGMPARTAGLFRIPAQRRGGLWDFDYASRGARVRGVMRLDDGGLELAVDEFSIGGVPVCAPRRSVHLARESGG